MWRVPSENYYTIIGKGAGGGLSSRGLGSSRGALAISVFELRKDEDIHILVGQKGENACTRNHCNRGNRDSKTAPSDLLKNPDDISSKTKLVFEEMAGGEQMAGGGKKFYFFFLSYSLFFDHFFLFSHCVRWWCYIHIFNKFSKRYDLFRVPCGNDCIVHN